MQRNGVITAVAEVDRLDQSQIAVGKERGSAVISQNDIGACSGFDLVAPGSTNHGVCSVGQCDGIGGPIFKARAFDRQQRTTVVKHHGPVVTQHDATCCVRCAIHLNAI